MSDTRMAGSKEFRDSIEERKGTEWYDKASKVGELHDPHMSKEDPSVARYSGAEIRAEMRAGRGDMTTEDLTKQYEKDYASGKINLNGNAKEFLREKHGAILERANKDGGDNEDDPIVSIDPIKEDTPFTSEDESGPTQTIDYRPGPSNFSGRQIQNVNQDNDINSTVTGDNNTVTNDQDNSVGQYGGTSTRFKDMWMKDYFS